MDDTRLHLLGQSTEDLPAISALLQDATLRLQDIAYTAPARRLVLLVNRYRWEAKTPSRVRCALRIETVLGVQRQNWPSDPEAVLALLALTHDGEFLTLSFSGGAAIRARTEVIEVVLEDLAAPWETARQPTHS